MDIETDIKCGLLIKVRYREIYIKNVPLPVSKCDDMKSILNVAPYNTYPPKSGGQIRIVNINLNLSKKYKIFQFSQCIPRNELKLPLKSWKTKINDNYIEYRFANIISLAFSFLMGKLHSPPIHTGDILKIIKPKILSSKLLESDLIQVEHPWQFEYFYKNKPENTPIILVEHNIESKLLEATNNSTHLAKKIFKFCKQKELFAIKHADSIFTTCQEDMDKLVENYGVDKNKIYEVPNGVDVSRYNSTSEEEKKRIKRKLGFNNKKIVLFTGWKHNPNFEAVNEILKMNKDIENDNIIFLIAGKVGENFKNEKNTIFTGYVDDMKPYFKCADIAINPMLSGSGTNLKILEYLASEIPTITTKTGARGLSLIDGKHIIISDIMNFPEWITYLLQKNEKYVCLKKNGRKIVEEKYDWNKIAEKQIQIYDQIFN